LRHYELIVVLSPILSQEEASGAWDRIKQTISEDGGGITHEEQWGMRRLAYPIRKGSQSFLEGNYFLSRFSTETTVPRELEGQLTISENVIRSLLVRTGEPPPPPPRPPEPEQAAEAVAEEAPAAEAGEPQPDTQAVAETDEAPAEEQAVATETQAVGADADIEAGDTPGPVDLQPDGADEPSEDAAAPVEAEEPVAPQAEESGPADSDISQSEESRDR
jgi:small subunit ribosomal protein S6